MKITDSRTKADTIFGKLYEGDVFFSSSDDEYYMVIYSIPSEGNDDDYNAVRLCDGRLDTFYTCDKVEKVNAELIISN
jgi:hypothetical protein